MNPFSQISPFFWSSCESAQELVSPPVFLPLFVQYALIFLNHLALVFLAQVAGAAEDSAARVDLVTSNLKAPADHPHDVDVYSDALAMLVLLAQVALAVEVVPVAQVAERGEPAAQVE